MRKRQGFSLTFVIIALMVMGTAMSVLTTGANTMLVHADLAYLRAVERNLIASGLAWAGETVAGDRDLPIGESVDLDTAAFGCREARLAVQFVAVQDGKAEVHIETSCCKGGRTLDTSSTFTLSIPETTQ